MARYKGYSSSNYETNGTFLLTDVQLVKTDLLNHLFTRRGERVRMPGFGTTIPDLVFEMLDETLIDVLYEQITNVVNYDPRISMVSLNITPDFDTNSVAVALVVRYVELNTTEVINFNIEFTG